jgi:uncharacterized membrane protein YjjP (DUF1212 family)
MYMERPAAGSLQQRPAPSSALYVAIAAALAGVLYLGMFPGGWLELSLQSVSLLVAGQ